MRFRLMIMTYYKLEFSRNLRDFADLGTNNGKMNEGRLPMSVHSFCRCWLYCQRQNCSPLNVLFSVV